MDHKVQHSNFKENHNLDVEFKCDKLHRKFEKFININTILFLAVCKSNGARIKGSTTFRGDIHGTIKKIEENNRYKVIGYSIFGKTYIIKPNTPYGLLDLRLD